MKSVRSSISELRDFTSRSSVLDLAVGVVIGLVLYKILDSAVNDLLIPIFAGLLGKADFSGLFVALAAPPAVPPTLEALRKAGVPVIAYGNFLAVVLTVVILTLLLALLVKQLNRLKHRGGQTPAEEIALLREIRDAVKRS